MEFDSVQKSGAKVLEFEKMWYNWNQRVQILKEPGSNPYLDKLHINFKTSST
jgi:hypothetical protein